MSKPALWMIAAGKKRELKARKRIRKVSKAMAKRLREYAKLKEEFLARPDNQWCPVAKAMGRLLHSTDVHHKRGRGKYLLDVSTWLAVSRYGHDLIHSNPAWATEHGWLLPRDTRISSQFASRAALRLREAQIARTPIKTPHKPKQSDIDL